MRTAMKFLASLGLVGLVAAGCSEQERVMQRVAFGVSGVRSGRIETRSGDMKSVLQETAPTGKLKLELQSMDDPSFVVEIEEGEYLLLPVGGYRLQGQYEAQVSGEVGGHALACEPMYSVDEVVQVVEGEEYVVLQGRYDCWALVLDKAESDRYEVGGEAIAMVPSEDGAYGVIYVSGREAGEDWTLSVVPKDKVNYGVTAFEMGRQENGKWYSYSAEKKGSQEGYFWVGLPEWEQGE